MMARVNKKPSTTMNNLFEAHDSELLESLSGMEIHMENNMVWKWLEMGHNLCKCYGLVWIWGKFIDLKRYNRYQIFNNMI